MIAALTDDALEFSSNCGWQIIEKALHVVCVKAKQIGSGCQ